MIDGAQDTADASEEAAPKTPRRRTKTSQSDQGTVEAAAGDADAAETADGEPQGIWGRFRSARKPRSS